MAEQDASDPVDLTGAFALRGETPLRLGFLHALDMGPLWADRRFAAQEAP